MKAHLPQVAREAFNDVLKGHMQQITPPSSPEAFGSATFTAETRARLRKVRKFLFGFAKNRFHFIARYTNRTLTNSYIAMQLERSGRLDDSSHGRDESMVAFLRTKSVPRYFGRRFSFVVLIFISFVFHRAVFRPPPRRK